MLTKRCAFSKRLFAFLIDFCLIVITSLFLKFAVSIPLFNAVSNYEDKCSQLVIEQVKTGLYFFVDEDFNVTADLNSEEKEILDNYKESKKLYDLKTLVETSNKFNSQFYLQGLENFYNLYNESFFNEKKLESNFFDNGQFKEDVSEKERLLFCNDIYSNVIKDINLYKEGLIANLLFEVSSLRIIIDLFAYFIAILVFWLIIPLCNKTKSSLGQIFLKLGVVDNYYIVAKWSNLILRALSIFIFEFILGVFTFGIIPIVSIVMMLLLSNGKCLHDLMSFTQVIDVKDFKPFNSIQEYKDYIEKEKENRDTSLRKPYV